MQVDRGGLEVTQNMRFSDIVVDDPKLSLAAKGLFAALGFIGDGCLVSDLLTHTSDDERQLREALDELVRAGYVSVEEDSVRLQRPGTLIR